MSIEAWVISATAILGIIGIAVAVWSMRKPRGLQIATGNALAGFGAISGTHRAYYGDGSRRPNLHCAWFDMDPVPGWYENDAHLRVRILEAMRPNDDPWERS